MTWTSTLFADLFMGGTRWKNLARQPG